MKQSVLRLLALISLIVTVSTVSFAQGSAAGSISGVVKDPNGAVVVGASVNVKNPGTGQEFSATSTDNGTFTIPAVSSGKYTVTIKAQGFKTAVIKDVEVLAATPANVDVALQVGAQNEEIQVSGAGEVLQTQSANVSNTIIGRQITDLPFASRNALDLVLFLPGVSSPARPRQSTVNGLPKGSLNITLDGINVQDNLLKSSDGFFTYVQPKTDAIDEVTVSSNTPGSESGGEGAVQVKFVTRGGNNSFNGSVYEYLRNPSLNANYYFNNLAGLPRSRVILNQPGFRVGGPIIKDRAFFFVNYEEYRLPEQTLRQKTIMTTDAQAGLFKYNMGTAAAPNIVTVNLFALAAATNCGTVAVPVACTSTADPTINALLSQIRGTINQGTVAPTSDQNLQLFSFINKGGQTRKFPTVRFDFNLTSKHHLENIYNYQQFDSVVDFLNTSDPAFPGFPNFGSQGSNRFSESIALRSIITPNIVNEFRFGLVGGTTRFFPEVTPAQFANQGGYSLGITAAGVSSATVQRAPQKRNSPVQQFTDNVTWTRGNHSMTFGMSFSQINLFSSFPNGGIVSSVTLGLATADTANGIFSSSSGPNCATAPVNFPCASTTQLTQAKNFYSVLTGRITGVSGTAVLQESTNKYQNLGNYIERDHQREMGYFGQDSWRFRTNLTLTGGVRWEVQFPFVPGNNDYAQTTEAELFGISGSGNLFKPGTMTGGTTSFTSFTGGNQAYNTQWKNIAPSIGLAWSPSFREGWMHKLGGESGQTVIRAGYSMAYVREGTNVVSSILGANPGGTLNTGVSTTLGNLTTFPTLFRNGVPTLVTPPANGPAYPITFGTSATDLNGLGSTANAFIPDLKTGRVHSWTFGIQREINKDTVVEFRYVGNRAMDMWRQYSINETDVQTNGFINEFNLAEQNFIANNANGHPGSFAYFGPGTGTSPLPVLFGFLQGACTTCANPAAKSADFTNYNSALWKNTSLTTSFNPALPSALGLAGTILTNPGTFLANQAAAGIARNYFVVNPGISSNAAGGGAFLVDNSNRSYYNGLVIELRRRLSKGLLFQGSYTFSKSEGNYYASSSAVAKNFVSLHNPGLDRSVSPFDISHALKANFIYELPIGKGQRFLDSTNSIADHLVSGWSFNGTARIQSGTPFSLGNVQLVGMTRQDLQDEIAIRHGANSAGAPVVFYLPNDIIQGTINAFNGTFAPTGRYIAPANMNSAIAFPGSVGFPNLVLYGPRYTRFDLSFVKKTRVSERINVEFRAELLDAFNNIDFRVTSPTVDVGAVGGLNSQTFGQTTFAYQDTSTTNDPGGRLIQFVLRVNF